MTRPRSSALTAYLALEAAVEALDEIESLADLADETRSILDEIYVSLDDEEAGWLDERDGTAMVSNRTMKEPT